MSQMNSVAYPVAGIMQRTMLKDRWGTEAWEAYGVVRDIFEAVGAPQVIHEDAQQRQILYPGFVLTLHRDEAEGYYLNVSSPAPRVFVEWREDEGEDVNKVRPAFVTVSYNEAARWMDSNEKVDGVPMPPEIFAWVGAFVERHYRPQPKKMRRRS